MYLKGAQQSARLKGRHSSSGEPGAGASVGQAHCLLFKEARESRGAVPLGAGSRTGKSKVEHSTTRLDREGPHHAEFRRLCKHSHAIFTMLGRQWKVLAGMWHDPSYVL